RIGDQHLTSDTLTLAVGDVEPPRITLSTPPHGVTPGTSFVLGFSASDNAGIVRAEARFTGAWTATYDLRPDGRLSFHAPFTVVVPPGPVPGAHIDLTVELEDVRGNTDSARWTFTVVDPVPPQVFLGLLGARSVMAFVGATGRQFYAHVSGSPMSLRVRANDGVGLSHVVVVNPLVGSVDTIHLSGFAADTTYAVAAVVPEGIRGWITAEAYDLAGNSRTDSLAAGIYHARTPPSQPLPAHSRYFRFAPDSVHFLGTGIPSGPVRVFALSPLRLVRDLPLASTSWSGDFTAGSDSVVISGNTGAGLYIGPLLGTAEDFVSIPLGAAPRFVAVRADGAIGATAQQTFPNILNYVLLSPSEPPTQIGPNSTDQRVARPEDGSYLVFGSGVALRNGSVHALNGGFASGSLSISANGDFILAGAALYDRDGVFLFWLTPPVEGLTAVRGAPTVTGIGPDGTYAWLGYSNDPEVVKVRVSDGAVLDRILLPFMPAEIALSPSGDFLVAGSFGSSLVIDLR
ncbi:MAG: hypothetical protein WD043_03610, partial [Gemmatimonadales bacterium]